MVTILPCWVRRTRSTSNSRGERSTGRSPTLDLVAAGVEPDRPDGQRALQVAGRTGRVAQGHADARPELGDPERLGHVVVGSPLERLDLLALLVPAREDQDRRRRLAADRRDHLEAVEVRQPEVEQDEGRPAGGEPLERRAGVLGLGDPEPGPRQLAHEHEARGSVVLDDEDLGAVTRRVS